MKRLGGGRVRWVCGLTALVLALMSLIASSVQAHYDKRKVAKMTENMKTRCVGRFLIDLPADAQVTMRYGAVGGFDISTSNAESGEEFAERLRKRELEIAGAVNEDGQPSMEASKELIVGTGRGKTFVHNRRRTKILGDNGYFYSENLQFLSMLRFPGVSVTGKIEWVAPGYIDGLTRILSRIRPLADGEIPRESGFCLGHVILQDPYEHDNVESVVMFAGIPGHPDVNIALSSMSGTGPAPGLLARHAKAVDRAPVFMRLAFSHLREHERAVNGLPGEELVLRAREPNFTTGYSFQWEMAGNQDDVHAPRLKLELESGVNPVSGGKPVQSTLTEEAMFELWERIVTSIRPRPAAPAANTKPDRPAVALGTSALAGETCPQTGWWHCGDGGNGIAVLGGQRQFLKQGQTMPQALLLPEQTMWQRLRGVQPSYESANATLWALVDKRNSERKTQPPGLEQALGVSEPGNMPAGAAPFDHVDMAIGSVAKTGWKCPVSGWWRCEDSQALDGTRWFAAGALLPAATFQALPRRNGVAHTRLIRRRSAWQLVRTADSASAS